jgi:hypothetical protein
LVLPPLRTVQADLPHTALQSVVLTSKRIDGTSMGLIQELEPLLGKHGRWVVLASHQESRQQPHAPRPRVELARSVDRGLSGGVRNWAIIS